MLRLAIDHEGIACLMTDAEARLIECSRAAIVLLEQGHLFELRHGRLSLRVEFASNQLRQMIARCTTGDGGIVRVPQERGFWLIQVVPVRGDSHDPFDPRCGGCALVFAKAPAISRTANAQQIRRLLDCTLAESEVAAALLGGCPPAQIANDRDVSLNTVRTQIRALLETAGVHRIPELLILLAGFR